MSHVSTARCSVHYVMHNFIPSTLICADASCSSDLLHVCHVHVGKYLCEVLFFSFQRKCVCMCLCLCMLPGLVKVFSCVGHSTGSSQTLTQRSSGHVHKLLLLLAHTYTQKILLYQSYRRADVCSVLLVEEQVQCSLMIVHV